MLMGEKGLEERIAEVEAKLKDARKRIPKHTPPRALFEEIDDLELELAELVKERDGAE
jgi:hypothetical protein